VNYKKQDYWDDAALRATKSIIENARSGSGDSEISIKGLRDILDAGIKDWFWGAAGPEPREVEWFWTSLGGYAFRLGHILGLINQDDRDYAITTARFVTGKQRDYGRENVARFGLRGLLVRAHDKVARLENLAGKNAGPTNEALEDTITDLIGYSIVGILWESGMFDLPLDPAPKLMTVAESERAYNLKRILNYAPASAGYKIV
jgi:hypothetical protein